MGRIRNGKYFLLTGLVLLCLGPLLHAQKIIVTADPSQSRVAFATKDNVHAINGIFRVRDGNFLIDPAQHKISGSMSVDATTGDSGSHMRDGNMHGKVLESGKYPVAKFTADAMDGELARPGDSHVRVHGVLNLHGSDHPLWLDFAVHVAGDSVTAKTSFPIPYVDWGMRDMSNFMFHLDKSVQIDVTLQGRLAAAP